MNETGDRLRPPTIFALVHVLETAGIELKIESGPE
jgi:hypothetical protein